MSESKQKHATGPVKTPAQFFWTAFAGFTVPIFLIIGLVTCTTSSNLLSPGASNAEEKVMARIAKVGEVVIGERPTAEEIAAEAAAPAAADAAAPASGGGIDLAAGKALYDQSCVACHGTGVAGAPKLGDKDAWAPLIAEGMDAMMHVAINGKGAMPPRGATSASDDELRNVVAFMVDAADPDAAKAIIGDAAPAEEAAAPAEAPQAETKTEAETPAAETETAAAEAPAADLAAGKALYDKSCVACHGTGVAGAPKLGDKDAWAPLIAEGMDAMMHIAINGKGAMPPRGATSASDDELHNAVAYMVDAAQ